MQIKTPIRHVKISALLLSYYVVMLGGCIAGAVLLVKAAQSFGFLVGVTLSLCLAIAVSTAYLFFARLIETAEDF
jgi:hypothetical protein